MVSYLLLLRINIVLNIYEHMLFEHINKNTILQVALLSELSIRDEENEKRQAKALRVKTMKVSLRMFHFCMTLFMFSFSYTIAASCVTWRPINSGSTSHIMQNEFY